MHEATTTPCSISAVYGCHEMMKKRDYGDSIHEVELASFTPLVFSTTGGMGRKRTVYYYQLANLLASKQDWAYGTTVSWSAVFLPFPAKIRHYVYSGQ